MVALLATAAVVGAGGLAVLSSTGAFDRTAGNESPGPVTRPPVRTTATVTATSTIPPAPSTARPSESGKTEHAPSRRIAYVFPIDGCVASASRAHHDYPAADIFTPVGCRFVSPVDGRVDEVNRTDLWNPRTNVGRDRGGLSVSVIGVDGVRYYGSHLSSVSAAVRPGLQVRAGQTLGLTGRTGSARNTPAHLHFGISWPTAANSWWIRRGAVSPQRYLDAWQKGNPLSPAGAVAKAQISYGVDRGCRSYC